MIIYEVNNGQLMKGEQATPCRVLTSLSNVIGQMRKIFEVGIYEIHHGVLKL